MLACLLLAELPLDLLLVTGFVDDRPGELCFNVGEPRTEAAHVFIQLLHGHQGLPQLFHPNQGTDSKNQRINSNMGQLQKKLLAVNQVKLIFNLLWYVEKLRNSEKNKCSTGLLV